MNIFRANVKNYSKRTFKDEKLTTCDIRQLVNISLFTLSFVSIIIQNISKSSSNWITIIAIIPCDATILHRRRCL